MGISQEELREIMTRCDSALVLYARQFLADADFHTAEEIVQEALLKLSREPDMPKNGVAWLYKTVRHGAISRQRSEKRRRLREQSRPAIPWFLPDPAAKLDAENTVEKLRLLDGELREMVTLHIWGNLSFTEIAELTELPRTTVFRRYEEGIAALRRLMKGNGDHDE
ncbi:MAG: sigma-70 family RNA polymerase sigma factor [Planctomycetaceae bacterium]|jgi:RNA polymerase sigma-70 factor (ECF subfamily)|nr:sigma-70 family RNA polymerase sigma factor [Planctomycetaceae bacterium]